MLKDYLIVERSALPDYFLKVLEAKRLLDSGECTQVSDAVRRVDISRSTFYKYRDKIMEPSRMDIGHKATLMLQLAHEAGMLSHVLNTVSRYGANILTITQSLPVHGQATITLSLDTGAMTDAIETMVSELTHLKGVEKVRLLAVD